MYSLTAESKAVMFLVELPVVVAFVTIWSRVTLSMSVANDSTVSTNSVVVVDGDA